jgi:hypothetical protein
MIRDLLGNRTTNELLEDCALLFHRVKKFMWKDLRPWSEFFAVFNLPQGNSRQIEQRVSTNLIHYKSNYCLACMLIFLCQILLSPIFLLSLILVVTLFGYFFFVQKKSIRIGEAVINEHGKLVICSIVSLVLLIITRTLEYLIWDVLFCFIICSVHALFRPRSITAKDDHLSEQLKMNGFNWINGPRQSSTSSTASNGTTSRKGGETDPENPPLLEELSFSTANPMNNSAAVRKRASNNNVSVINSNVNSNNVLGYTSTATAKPGSIQKKE